MRSLTRHSSAGLTAVFSLTLVTTTQAAFAAPVDTLPALKEFTAAGGALDVTMTMSYASTPTMIGRDISGNPIPVDGLAQLAVCDTATPSDCAAPYGGVALKISAGDTLRAKLINTVGGTGGPMVDMCMDETAAFDPANGWTSVGGLINEHFHGLLVPATGGRPDDPLRPFGDYIFTCASGTGDAAERSYALDIPASHPNGVDWFHPHVHGIAKPQVSSGMAGMLLIGEPECSDPSACAIVRPMILKDAQLVQVNAPDGEPHWLNFADQDPDFCGENKRLAGNMGACDLPPETTLSSGGVDVTPLQGRWIFTLNGAQYPTIVAAEPQVWRVQNASANITYKLSLRRLNADPGQVVAEAPFEVISLDGAGLAGSSGAGQLAPQAREVLLMPGSRADLRIMRPEDGGGGELAYQLVNEAFQAGFAPDDADTWPHIALAEVVFPEPPMMIASGTPTGAGDNIAAGTRSIAAARQPQLMVPSASGRLRVPVQVMPTSQLRGTSLTRPAAPLEPPAFLPLPPEAAVTPAPSVAAPMTEMMPHASPAIAGANPPNGSDMALAPQARQLQGLHGPLGDLFAMSRWLREDCDGYDNADALAQADVLLAAAVPGHQPIGSQVERRIRYWTGLHFDPRTTHRRLYFGIQDGDGDERFVLGETLVMNNPSPFGPRLVEADVYGRPISPTNPVLLTTFDPKKGLCVLKRARVPADPAATVEQWELVNVSKEVHNFHIHQMKFTVARDTNGQAIMRTPSAADLVLLPASLLLTTEGEAPAELQHDTILVPRGVTACESSLKPLGAPASAGHPVEAFWLDRGAANTACRGQDAAQSLPATPAGTRPDGSGMILLNMSFDGDWLSAQRDGDAVLQPARFVFHCHILEHEDKGMMHRIAVLDPHPVH